VKPDNLSSEARRACWRVAALLAIAALVVFVRLRLLQVPLERDEGEYACSGQLMLDGVRFLVVVQVSSSWLLYRGADETLDVWAVDYMRRFYDRVGMAHIYPDRSDYVWGPESGKGRGDTQYVIVVYQRKEQI
jgi:hypothetical protein